MSCVLYFGTSWKLGINQSALSLAYHIISSIFKTNVQESTLHMKSVVEFLYAKHLYNLTKH